MHSRKSIQLLMLLLLIPWAVNSEYTVKSISITDPEGSNENLPPDYSLISSEVGQDDPTPLSINPNIGTFFDDAIEITMVDQGNIRFGSTVQEFNQSQPVIFLQYQLNETAPVKVTFQSAQGSLIDTDRYEIFMNLFEGDGFEFHRDFRSSFETGGLPLIIDYFAEDISRKHYLQLEAFDLVDFDITGTESLRFNVTIEQLGQTAAPVGAKSITSQSAAFEQIDDIRDFFLDRGYLDEFSNINLGDFDINDISYAQGIGSAVYGLLKAGELIANSEKADLALQDIRMAEFMQIAKNLIDIANTTMMDPSGFFYYRPTESAPLDTIPDYTVYLEDNVWMLVALGELQWYADRFGPLTQSIVDPLSVRNQMGRLGDWIVAMFESGVAGEYRYRVSLTDFADNGDGFFGAGNDTTAFVRDDLVYLEEVAVLMDVLRWNFGMINADGTIEMDEILNYIDTTMRITSVDGIPLSSNGIFAEYYDTNLATLSDTVTLLGNAAYLLHINTRVKESFEADRRLALDNAGDIAQNILRVFGSENPDTSGLLYSKINVTNRANSERFISTLDNSYMIAAINRIGINWEELDPFIDNIDATSKETNSRAWKRKSIDQFNRLRSIMFDDIDQVFFAKYDDQAKLLLANDNNVSSNAFVANSFLLTILADAFPIQMEIIYNTNIATDKTAQITLLLSQISTLGTWIWFDGFNPFTIDAKVSIPEFNFEAFETVDLFASFLELGPTGDVFLSFFYDVEFRGEYTVIIELSLEGTVLLTQTLNLVALGQLSVEFTESQMTFSTTDSTFSASFFLFDERGLPIPSLSVEASLGDGIVKSKQNFGATYVETGRTDSSGKIILTFETSDIEEDAIIDRSAIFQGKQVPDFVEIEIFVNVTNVDSFNLELAFIRLPVRVQLAKFYGDFDISSLEFATNDDEFKATITILDDNGIAVSNLDVDASLGSPIQPSRLNFGDKYIESATTDSSGKATFTFDVSDYDSDFIDRGLLDTLPVFPEFVFAFIQLNITDEDSFNYAGFVNAEARVILSQVILRTSPTNLEITQGTTEAFTFSVTALDQDQTPIANELISYTLDLGIYSSSNSVTTDANGEASITLRDADLFALSNLAIRANSEQDPTIDPDPISVNGTIIMSLGASGPSDYPETFLVRPITVQPNAIKINANPVQTKVDEKTIFQTSTSNIEIEVATEDLFSRVINAFVSLEWVDPSNNQYFDLSEDKFKGKLSPLSFKIEPTNLPAGEYQLRVIAVKDGITTTVIVDAGLELTQVNSVPVSIPAIVQRTIIVEENTLQDILLSGIALFGAFFLLQFLSILRDQSLKWVGIVKACPHCTDTIGRRQKVCNHCGRDIPGKDDKPASDLKEPETSHDEDPLK